MGLIRREQGLKKRLISLHLSSAPSAGLSVVQGLQLLVEHCDSIYVDPESWLLLASTYASLQKHEQSLSALSDLLLLAPQNAFYVLRFAETAYTLEDFELAYRYYLRAVELAGPRGIQASGVGRRAALGIKLVRHLSFYEGERERETPVLMSGHSAYRSCKGNTSQAAKHPANTPGQARLRLSDLKMSMRSSLRPCSRATLATKKKTRRKRQGQV